MKTITFNREIILIKTSEKYGHSSGNDVESNKFKCNVSQPSISLKTQIESTGRSVDLTVQMWRRDFESNTFTHAKIDDVRYRIESATSGLKTSIVKLILVRG